MSSLSSIVPGSRLRMRSLQLRLNSASRLLQDSDSVSWDASCLEDLRWWTVESHLLVGLPLGLSHPSLLLFRDASDSCWGSSLNEDHMSGSWSLTCSQFSINHQELLAVLYGVQGSLPLLRDQSVSLFADNTTAYLRNQGGTHSSLLNSVAQAILRLCEAHRVRLVPYYNSRAPECAGGHPESSFTGPRVGMDPLFSSVPVPSSSVAGDDRPVCHFVEPLPSSLIFADGRSAVGGHGCDDAVVGWSAGLCLPSLRPAPARHREGPAVSGVGAHVGSSILASAPLVSGPSGVSGGCPSVPSTSEGSTQTASLPSFPPEPPHASPDCVSYIERSARTFGFPAAVARQLARCRRSSTRVNYQAKWSVYRAVCARHGHSVSRPSVPKVASFLLYLRRSLSLSVLLFDRFVPLYVECCFSLRSPRPLFPHCPS